MEQFTVEPREAVEKILSHMADSHKRGEIELLPYQDIKGYDTGWPSFDFSLVTDSYNEGDSGYVAADFIAPYDKEMVFTLSGDTTMVFNGEIPSSEPYKDMKSFFVKFKEGVNRVIFKHTSRGESRFEIYIGPPQMRIYWPGGYIYKTRPTIPLEDFTNQEGMAYSRVYKKGESLPPLEFDKIEWVGPKIPAQPEKITFDFNSRTNYIEASAISWGKGEISFEHFAPIKVYAAGELIYEAESGVFSKFFEEETAFVVECFKKESFGFTVLGGEFSLPFYKCDKKDLTWLYLEGITGEANNIQFKRTYKRADGTQTYYKFYREETTLRPYLNTSFFGQWFYAIMVGHYGLLNAAKYYGFDEYIDLFNDSMKTIAEYYDYIQYEKENYRCVTFLNGSTKLHDLDSIGTFGINFSEYVKMTGDEKGNYMLDILEKSLENVPRTELNSFYRVKTLWADDCFMSIPFLARLGQMRDKKYFDDAVVQVKGFRHYLYMKDKNIYSHIYFPEDKKANRIPWGRGNGWVIFALSELLMHMPEDYSERETVLDAFRELAEGIKVCQGKNGMWHQLIDEETTYEESSGTCMFIIALARGIKYKWTDDSFRDNLIRAWNRLSETCIDDEGNIMGICVGSGCNKEREYYRVLPPCVNDDHGVGIFLLAATEVDELSKL